jgi:MYXO-CTERM domain-containing protein
MLLLVLTAHADDLTWTCVTATAPVDVHPWAPDLGSHGAGDAGRAAYDLLAARVDADCPADCVGVETIDCPARSCTTAAGDTVEWEASSESDDSGYGGSSRRTVHVRVEPAADAGLGWTWAELTRASSDSHSTSSSWSEGTSWNVAWGGVLDPDWPADGAFSAVEGDSNEGSREGWSDGSCAWSNERNYTYARVTMNGREFQVYDPGEAAVCWGWHPDAELGGVAYVDGAIWGVVDRDTWADAAGTDADADGWTLEEGDCDDADPAVYCYADEIEADGIDNDCNGTDGTDADRDGWVAAEDCNDFENDVHPGATDTAGDGVDADCDGVDGVAPTDTADTAAGADTADSADTAPSGDTADSGAPAAPPDAAETPEGCGCAGTSGRRGFVAMGLALLFTARRRRNG